MDEFFFRNFVLNRIINGNVIFRRAIAVLIDMFVIGGISLLPEYIVFLLNFKYDTLVWIFFVGILTLIRDAFGRSLGKAIMRLQVIDVRTRRSASWQKKIIRNITTPFWMIELTVCFITKGLRLTDFWCGTKVVSDTDL